MSCTADSLGTCNFQAVDCEEDPGDLPPQFWGSCTFKIQTGQNANLLFLQRLQIHTNPGFIRISKQIPNHWIYRSTNSSITIVLACCTFSKGELHMKIIDPTVETINPFRGQLRRPNQAAQNFFLSLWVDNTPGMGVVGASSSPSEFPIGSDDLTQYEPKKL